MGALPSVVRDLLPLVYGELRRLAALRLADESPGRPLQPTALVHEAYLSAIGVERASSPAQNAGNRVWPERNGHHLHTLEYGKTISK